MLGDYLNAGFGDIPGLSAEVWVGTSDLARVKRSSVSIKAAPKQQLSLRKARKYQMSR